MPQMGFQGDLVDGSFSIPTEGHGLRGDRDLQGGGEWTTCMDICCSLPFEACLSSGSATRAKGCLPLVYGSPTKRGQTAPKLVHPSIQTPCSLSLSPCTSETNWATSACCSAQKKCDPCLTATQLDAFGGMNPPRGCT